MTCVLFSRVMVIPGCELLLGVNQSPHTLKVTFVPDPLSSRRSGEGGGEVGSLGEEKFLTLSTTAMVDILPAPLRILWQRPTALRMDEALQSTHLQARLVTVNGDRPHPPRGLYDEMLNYYTVRAATKPR